MTFKVNQKEIAAKLCLLREIKDNSCNGNCVLEKELKKASDKEKQDSNHLKEKQEIVYTSLTADYTFETTGLVEKTPLLVSLYCNKSKSVATAVFHPPLL